LAVKKLTVAKYMMMIIIRTIRAKLQQQQQHSVCNTY
jgi:hypothetical protein